MSRLAIWTAMILFAGCSGKDKLPDGILKPKQMQEVLWDMVRADALTPELVKKDSSLKATSENIDLYNKVFSVHHISRTIFQASFSYYEKNADLMNSLLDSMNALQQRRIQNRYLPQKTKVDTAAKS